MQTQKKQQNKKPQQRTTFQLPSLVTIDELAVMTDGDLHARLRSLYDEHGKVAKEHYDSYAWQIEIAYAQREADIRFDRAELHKKFLDETHDDDEFVDERDLPDADLDNSRFLNIRFPSRRWN
jgi:hypothetical protein